ncbi:hypothetical protein V5O48_016338 [Marasmius crinis-equi]|uniref:F-box domain-containing protein n=1 Tax=Marasmius crinis-equi TaxID=585013 RepID=A0ABR3ES98_9AGAR
MGTRGYIVYRYKRVRYYLYNHCDSYPDGLGADLVEDIPKPSDGEGWQCRFEEWLEENRRFMERMISEATKDMSPDEVENLYVEYRSREGLDFNGELRTDSFIKWIYEIDLDNLCFLVNSRPRHRLDYMPPAYVFAYGPDASDEPIDVYDYVHKLIPYPSEEDPVALQNYSESCTGTVALHELLIIDECLSHIEQLRLRWVEFLIAYDMRKNEKEYYDVLKLEANDGIGPLDAIPPRSRQKLQDLLHQIFRPYCYGSLGSNPLGFLPGCADIYLLRSDVVFCIHNHLDNADALRTGSYYLFRAIMDNWTTSGISQERVVYGILFSGKRCAIVRVDREEAKFAHTKTMVFFPDEPAVEGPSTKGIIALARMASRIDPDCFATFGSKAAEPVLTSSAGLLDKLPAELLDNIAHYFIDFHHLRGFAGVSTRTRDAALRASVSYIFFKGFRFVGVANKDEVGPGLDVTIAEKLEERKCYSDLFYGEIDSGNGSPAFCAVRYRGAAPKWPETAVFLSRPPREVHIVNIVTLALDGEVLASLKHEEYEDEAEMEAWFTDIPDITLRKFVT